MTLLYFVWLAARWTMDPIGVLCNLNARYAERRRLSLTPLYDPPPGLQRLLQEFQATLDRLTVKQTTDTDHPCKDLNLPPFVVIRQQRLQ
jgi:hypothetical protein